MAIVAAFMVPHPVLSIPEIGKGKENDLSPTVASFRLIAKQIAHLHPETIVWISPHAESYADFFQIADGEVGIGSFQAYGAPDISFRMLYDKELAREISFQCKAEKILGGVENGEERSIDHGTMVPLYYVNQEFRDFLSVRVGVSGQSLAEHYRFGQAIRQAVDKLNRNVVIIASGDLSHCQSRLSANGYRPEGIQYDEQIMRIMGKGNFGELLSFNRHLLGQALQCGHPAFTIMAGCLDRYDVEPMRLSHEAPFGIGYGFVGYTVKGENPSRAFLELYQSRERLIAKEKAEKADVYVRLARQAIETYIATKRVMKLSETFDPNITKRKAGVFVTIRRDGELRGCIGTIKAKKKCVGEEIIANAIAAACKDERFEPLQPDQLDNLIISVDVIQNLIPILGVADLDSQLYGVMVEWQDHHAVLLPNLPGIDTPEQQISVAKRKAGIDEDEEITLYRFEVKRHQ